MSISNKLSTIYSENVGFTRENSTKIFGHNQSQDQTELMIFTKTAVKSLKRVVVKQKRKKIMNGKGVCAKDGTQKHRGHDLETLGKDVS